MDFITPKINRLEREEKRSVGITVESISYTPKIHLKLNDNEASSVILNTGTLGNGINLDFSDSPANTTLTYNSSGKINGAYNAGSSYRIDFSSEASEITSDEEGTICFWFYATGNVGFTFNTGIFTFDNGLSYPNKYQITATYAGFAGSTFIITYQNGGSPGWAQSYSGLSVGWHFVCIKKSGTSITISLDNIPTTITSSYWINTINLSKIYIGYGGVSSTSFYRSMIDDFRYYSIALSDDQISTIYNLGNGTEEDL